MAAANIRDVAHRAGVSVASVSRALNGHSNVHPDTRAKVNAAAKALGYVPHAGARSLSMARTHAIGVVLPDLHGEFFSEIVRGMDREASGRGYQLLLSNMHADIDMASHATRAMRGRVDGLVVMAPQVDAAGLEILLPPGLPAVLVHSADGSGRPLLRIDSQHGAETMTRHLLAIGKRRIVHITGPAGNIDSAERQAGFLAAMAERGDAEPIVVAGDFSDDGGAAAVRDLLAVGTRFDAVFAANDMMALGALTVLRDAGIDVPGDVAVAGFDDVPLARYLALTTMRVHMAEIGAQAVARLVAQLEGKGADASTELLVPDLVVRQTTQSEKARR
ncbi:LacI family DNA-binding transcriptional regulator [Sphingomonas sp. EC-HK361]|uniref:LacI family DNA-binding transcriptional regulator n=1 Tax=Sphingomonas sp. EC-HK361 TaxID=2038397 RepID=UPI00125FB02F|nr:LacI family DNA-binding transcriptional regulator [Sphingomonas sp. EC-HK361]